MTNINDDGSKTNAARTAQAEAPHAIGANLSEAGALRRVKAGDREAMEALLAAARPRLCAVALKIVHNSDDADDVVQEAMLKVWRYVGKFEGRAALSTWLHRIVVNAALDFLRSRRNGPAVVRSGDDLGDEYGRSATAVHEDTPEDALARVQLGAVVRRQMAALSPVHQEVLALREFEGESYQEIAALARCPVGTVMSRLHHARHRLAESLATDCADIVPRAA